MESFFIFFIFCRSDSFAIEALMALAEQKSVPKTGPEIVSGIRKLEKSTEDDRFVLLYSIHWLCLWIEELFLL